MRSRVKLFTIIFVIMVSSSMFIRGDSVMAINPNIEHHANRYDEVFSIKLSSKVNEVFEEPDFMELENCEEEEEDNYLKTIFLIVDKVCSLYENVDPYIVKGLIWVESRGDPYAKSYCGGYLGLMQIGPKWHSKRMEDLCATDLFNPYENILVGVDYLSELLERYDGNYYLALGAYNMGNSKAEKLYYNQGPSDYSINVITKAEEYKNGST